MNEHKDERAMLEWMAVERNCKNHDDDCRSLVAEARLAFAPTMTYEEAVAWVGEGEPEERAAHTFIDWEQLTIYSHDDGTLGLQLQDNTEACMDAWDLPEGLVLYPKLKQSRFQQGHGPVVV